jgi:hypothetical protein
MLLSTILKERQAQDGRSTPTSRFKAQHQELKAPSSYSKGSNDSKPTKATQEPSTLQDLNHNAENLLTLVGTLDGMTPANLIGISTRFRQDTFGSINSSVINFYK